MKDYWKPAIAEVMEYRRQVDHNQSTNGDDSFDFGTADVARLLEIIEVQARALDISEETIRMGCRVTGTKAAQRRWRAMARAALGKSIEWEYKL